MPCCEHNLKKKYIYIYYCDAYLQNTHTHTPFGDILLCGSMCFTTLMDYHYHGYTTTFFTTNTHTHTLLNMIRHS